jgi:hypothetical protein
MELFENLWSRYQQTHPQRDCSSEKQWKTVCFLVTNTKIFRFKFVFQQQGVEMRSKRNRVTFHLAFAKRNQHVCIVLLQNQLFST